MAFITFDHVALATPDGRPLFSDLTLSLGSERIGLVGRNGSGKSSLLTLAASGQPPADGKISVTGKVALLRQLSPDDALSVPDALGIREEWARLTRIEAGQGSAADFNVVDWDLATRVDTLLTGLGLPTGIMGRSTIGTLSGGERARVALAELLVGAPDIILLDEPTNNLDDDGRAAISALLANWKGGALIASHDRALLGQMDRIVELNPIGVRIHSGGWDSFAAAREADRIRKADALE